VAQQYWLIKSEPNKYSWDDLVAEKDGMWDGVRNHTAAKNLRTMAVGDQVFFYHSNIGIEVVGIAEVTKEYYIDPTDPKGRFVAVNFKPVRKLGKTVTLKAIKANPKLEGMELVRQSRLSVAPVREEEWKEILKMAGE
jgi:predicted RNA-binding protein with PUA-like domain